MHIGRVRWFREDKGFGFIDGPDGDVYVRSVDVVGGPSALVEGQPVRYERLEETLGPRAIRVQAGDRALAVTGPCRRRTLLLYEAAGYEGAYLDLCRLLTRRLDWMDAMECEVGMIVVGSWPIDCARVLRMVQTRGTYVETVRAIYCSRHGDRFEAWGRQLADCTDGAPIELRALPAEVLPAVVSTAAVGGDCGERP